MSNKVLDHDIEISENEIKEALERPSDFGYWGNDKMFDTWSLGPCILHRDSDLIEESNRDALIKYLKSDPTLNDDWQVERSSHWAVGWVEHLTFRAVEKDGTPTRIFKILKDWSNKLQDYPLADEDDYCRREFEQAIEDIENNFAGFTDIETRPDDWANQLYGWLFDNNFDIREGGDWPTDKDVILVCKDLGFLNPEYDEETEEGEEQ